MTQKKKPGVKSTFNQDMFDVICKRLADGESLRAICRTEGMPPVSTVRLWAAREDNAAQYTMARDAGMEALCDELLEITDAPIARTPEGKLDSADVQHRRIKVDTRKWLMSKIAPKRYGDRLNMELTGKDGGPVKFSNLELASRISAILASAEKRKEADVSDLV